MSTFELLYKVEQALRESAESTNKIVEARLQVQVMDLETRIKELESFTKSIAKDYDHDDDTREHRDGYGAICRQCWAERLLAR